MITARKSQWFERVFAVYNKNLIARRFEGLRVGGLNILRERPHDAPLVLYANHSSWWDGLMVFQLGRECGLEQYAMMEERQLREYPFHRKLGAFSVVRENPREAMRSINYAADLLSGTNRTLWIFPQGKTEPNSLRPLKFYSGAARIIEKAETVYAAPVALRFEFLDDFRPEAFARVGDLQKFSHHDFSHSKQAIKNTSAALAENLTATLDSLVADITQNNLADYVEIIAPQRRRKSRG
jgi:hypothetical protein